MRKSEKRRVKICFTDPRSDLMEGFVERLRETELVIELSDKTGVARADLICLALTKEGIRACKKITADPFLSHISIVFVANDYATDEIRTAGFDGGALHIFGAGVTGPDSDKVFVARLRSLISLTRSRLDLVHRASTDYLTNLSSRRFLFESLKRVFLNHKSLALASVGCLMIDIDHLKVVNDSRGHSAGDKALVDVADLIRESVRNDDVVARIGGDEIAVVLPGIDMENLTALAERIRSRVEDDVPVVTASIGLAFTLLPVKCTRANVDWFIDDLVVRADRGLYNAKEGGRNRVALS